MSERDTQFSGFAKLLWSDILAKIEQIEVDNDDLVDGCSMCSTPPAQVAALIEPLIAERAYDLVAHAMTDLIDKHDGNIELFDVAGQGEGFAQCVPDMTEWPKPE